MKNLTLILLCCLCISCNNNDAKHDKGHREKEKFSGNYNKTFNDLHDLHLEAAIAKGITPLEKKEDSIHVKDKLVRLPYEIALYKIDKLKHSIPYLVPEASQLVIDICRNFRDSLISKNIPMHKPILTSLIRTEEDVTKLTKKNSNASDNSAHCYGTTFDISWKRYEALNPYDTIKVSTEKLKFVMGQVLSDLKQEDRCYVKHEKRQACFHITVR